VPQAWRPDHAARDGRNNPGEALLEVMDALNYCAELVLLWAKDHGMKKRPSLPPTKRPQLCLEVRSSPISGRGLFALDCIERGARILEYTGARVTYEEGLRRYEGTVPFHTFLISLDDERAIDGGVGGSDARFINHSCQPNCTAYIERGRVFIYARRPIPAGRELFLDYGLEAEDHEKFSLYACRCSASRCRGTMAAISP
jgi:uncharacterized protein